MFTWWKMRKFRQQVEKLNVGATSEQICMVLGEPLRKIISDEDEAEYCDETWSFLTPRRNCEFEIALKDGVYSYAWWSWHP